MTTTTSRPLSKILAREAMHGPLVMCDPATDLHHVASRMAAHRMHAVVVDGLGPYRSGPRPDWAVITAEDVVRAAVSTGPGVTAGGIASEPVILVDVADDLEAVARTLTARRCSHAIVTDDGTPVGVLSSLDVVAALAGRSTS